MAAAASDSPLSSPSPSSSSPSKAMKNNNGVRVPLHPPPPQVIWSPCAACKILRRRCLLEKCVLAPYFPPTDPLKFTIAHKVFGASNIIKFLLELKENERADAVNSMVYEGKARIKDPIYGCAGAISHLQNQINELQAELAKSKAEMLNLQCQNDNLVSIICNFKAFLIPEEEDHHHQELLMAEYHHNHNHHHQQFPMENTDFLVHEDVIFHDVWEPLLDIN